MTRKVVKIVSADPTWKDQDGTDLLKPINPTITDSYVAFDVTHDQFFKLTFAKKRRAIEFLKLVLDKKLLDQLRLDKLKVKDNTQLDEEFKEYRSDMIYKVPHKEGGETYIHVIIEHKSNNDFGAIFQLANYVMTLHANEAKRFKNWKKGTLLSPVIPIILHQGRSVFTGATELSEVIRKLPGADKYQIQMKAFLFDLSAIDQTELDERIGFCDENATKEERKFRAELWAILSVMKNIFHKRARIATFKQIMETLKLYLDDSHCIELTRNIVHYFGSNARNLSDAQIKDIDNTVHKTVGGENMQTFTNSYFKAGKAEGQAKAIVQILGSRFQSPTISVEKKLSKITNLELLAILLERALYCDSIQAFADSLNSTPTCIPSQ